MAEMKGRKVRKNVYVPSFKEKGRSTALHAFPAMNLSLEKEGWRLCKLPGRSRGPGRTDRRSVVPFRYKRSPESCDSGD